MTAFFMLAADPPVASTLDNLTVAGGALWAIVASNGVAAIVGGVVYHYWRKRKSRR